MTGCVAALELSCATATNIILHIFSRLAHFYFSLSHVASSPPDCIYVHASAGRHGFGGLCIFPRTQRVSRHPAHTAVSTLAGNRHDTVTCSRIFRRLGG